MGAERLSGLKMMSLGIVVKAKPAGTDIIQVDPIEQFSLENGMISAESTKFNVALPNNEGVVKQSKLTGGPVIEAKWIRFGGGSQTTSPDVQANETVMLWQYADTQDYYWTEIFREPALRRLEHVVYSYSNLPSGMTTYDPDTSYWLMISTRDKLVKLHTSDNDGEATTYDLTIDTRAGSFTVEDGLGNLIELDSTRGVLRQEINEEIFQKTKRMRIEAADSIDMVSKSINSECSTMTTTAESSTVKGGKHTVESEAVMTAGLGVSGGEGAVVNGGFKVKGDIEATGTIMDGGGNSNHHSH